MITDTCGGKAVWLGTGDVAIGVHLGDMGDTRGVGVLTFNETSTVHPIGETIPGKVDLNCAPVLLVFKKTESVDVLAERLRQMKQAMQEMRQVE